MVACAKMNAKQLLSPMFRAHGATRGGPILEATPPLDSTVHGLRRRSSEASSHLARLVRRRTCAR